MAVRGGCLTQLADGGQGVVTGALDQSVHQPGLPLAPRGGPGGDRVGDGERREQVERVLGPGRVGDRREQAIAQALREFEYQAHYLNLLELLGEQLNLSDIHLQAATQQTPAVNVDIILDVGNSHTCGILVEDHPEESNGLKRNER